ncbi:MAG TPA: CoA-binding protein [Aquifex aeolicus]|uniref:CoA-binding protein n=1 Tax=Aquifex aeolicus TaxID=63363 RepID=A0A7C5Q3E0_AQUAO|nr:CoA-binding protein [Aquifex aeolicus]
MVGHREEALEKLRNAKVVAVVGISPKPERPSYYTTEKLLRRGRHRVYFVNPRYAGEEIMGIKVLSSLREIPEKVDIVNVYRNPAHIEPIVQEALEIGARVVWLQPGAENMEVVEKYRDRIEFVYNACIGIEAGYL